MNKNLANIVLIAGLLSNNKFNLEFDEYSMNPEVNECQIYMYLLLMATNPEDIEELNKLFEESFNKLDEKQKEYIKQDFKKVCAEHDRKIKEQQDEQEEPKQKTNKRRDIYE